MEALKAMMAKKKEELKSNKLIDQGQLERKRQEAVREEIQQREREKERKLIERLQETDKFYQSRKKVKHDTQGKEVLLPEANIDESTVSNGCMQQTPPMPKEEIILKLRELNQPITLFGEDDWSRYRRLKKCEEHATSQDLVLSDLEFQRKIRDDEEYEELDARFRNRLIEPRLMDDMNYRSRKMRILEDDRTRDISVGQKCDEMMLWIKKVLKAWGETLEQKYNTEDKKKSSAGKKAVEIYRLSCEHLQPFFTVLRQRGGDKQIINSSYTMMNNAVIRDYTAANDRYIEISIGNAPWPMGVCMLGITVRRNAQRVSHVLNDEMSRKWMQAIKRLLTVSQEMYPNEDVTKMVLYSSGGII